MGMWIAAATGETPVGALVFTAVCGALFLAFGAGMWTKAVPIAEAMRGRGDRTGAAPKGFPSAGYVRVFGSLALVVGVGLLAFVLGRAL
ncbi:hypothetical protein [Streptomyces laurentii]|uniref:hypothetical protein n=1 Tax=Streptomyces laurentii TaxID=39478 RepID=UPI0036B369E0